jgi:uncharacterized protein YgfB (UPF0149 family)
VNDTVYDDLSLVFTELKSDLAIEEGHGALCGLLCVGKTFDIAAWLTYLTGNSRLDGLRLSENAARRMDAVTQAVYAALISDDYEFELLLPGDEADLAERTRALAVWCQGFLSGLGLGGSLQGIEDHEDVQGFLRDVERMSRVAELAEGDESDEQAWLEVTEYARLGVMMVAGELQALASEAENDERQLH